MADDFETKFSKFHDERKEHGLDMQNAQAHQSRCDERTDDAHTQDNGHMHGDNFEEECEASRNNGEHLLVLIQYRKSSTNLVRRELTGFQTAKRVGLFRITKLATCVLVV